MNASPENKSLTLLMIISMVFWGLSWPSNHVLVEYGSPIDLGVIRYALVVLSLPVLLLILKVPFTIHKKGIPFLLISGLLMAVYNYTFLTGLQSGSAAAGAILVTTMNPIMAYVIGMVVDRKRPTLNESIGLGLGVLGCCALLEIWSNVNIFANPWNVFFLLSAFIWAVMSKFTSKSAKYGSPFAFSWWMYIVTMLILLPFMDFPAAGKILHITEFKFWGNLLFGSVIVTTLATTLFFFATAKIGAEKASSFIFTVPFTAAFFSWMILGEIIEWHTIVGGILGIGAVYMINRRSRS